MKTRKPSVGETLYMLNVGDRAGGVEQVLRPVIVIRVGRKYFTVCEPEYEGKDWMHERFYIDSWRHDAGGYAPCWALYESAVDFEREKQRADVRKYLSGLFDWNGDWNKLSNEAMVAMKQIAEKELGEENGQG